MHIYEQVDMAHRLGRGLTWTFMERVNSGSIALSGLSPAVFLNSTLNHQSGKVV